MTSENILIIRNLFRNGRFKIESWKYYEIVDELRAMGIDQAEAYSAGKWAARAKPGERMEVGGKLVLEIKPA